jgi:SRSO17 transposase
MAGEPPNSVVLMDAGYGNDTDLRTQVTALGLSYVAGIGANTAVWPPGTAPLPPLPESTRKSRSLFANGRGPLTILQGPFSPRHGNGS